jgi:AhpD family alkylhydroperoxidase
LPVYFGFYCHSEEIVMTKEVLSQKEKELIAVGGSVAAGCVKCSHYHFRQAFEQGASQDEVLRAVIGATEVINDSMEILQSTAYELMDIERDEVTTGTNEATDSLTALIKLAAAVAVNNVANTRRHIEAANRLGWRKLYRTGPVNLSTRRSKNLQRNLWPKIRFVVPASAVASE